MEQQQSNISIRLCQFAEAVGSSVRRMEIRLKWANGSIKSMSGMTAKKLDDIVNTFPDLNVGWLMTGKGEMLNSNSEEHRKLVDMEILLARRDEQIRLLELKIIELERIIEKQS